MKLKNFLLFFAIFVHFCIECFTMKRKPTNPSQIVDIAFATWQSNKKISFANKTAHNAALSNFKVNYMKILHHQLSYYGQKSKFQTKLNKFAALADKSVLNGAIIDESVTAHSKTKARAISLPTYPKPPPTLDYRDKGLVTDVVDQGCTCSSCYAFASACGLEGQVAKKFGKLVQLSPQNIVDCSANSGCRGGSMPLSYSYIIKNSGIANSSAYPYKGRKGSCSYKPSMFAQTMSSYNLVTGDENNLKSALAAIGPLPVAIRGSLDSFYYYSSGIYDDLACGAPLDHAVCLVGYGTDNSTSPPIDYWILKNSWSTDWGENGYFRLKMGSNLCGISNYVVYPTI